MANALLAGLQGGLQGFQTGLGIIDHFQQRKTSQQQAQASAQDLANKQNVMNTRKNFIRIENMVDYGFEPQEIESLLIENIQNAEQTGGNPIDSVQSLNVLREKGVGGLKSFLSASRPAFENLGLLPQRQSSEFKPLGPQDLDKFTSGSIAKYNQTGNLADLIKVEGAAPTPKYLENLEKEVRTNVGKLELQGQSLRTNAAKVQNLAEQVGETGNRTAASQLIVALLKMGDPTSVARESEVEAALAKQNPVAALTDYIRGTGTGEGITKSVLSSIDPLNPKNIRVDEIVQTAEGLLKPNASELSKAYQRQLSRSNTAGLSEGQIKSIFDDTRGEFFNSLGEIKFTPVQQQEQQEEQQQQQPQVMTEAEANSIVDSLIEGL